MLAYRGNGQRVYGDTYVYVEAEWEGDGLFSIRPACL